MNNDLSITVDMLKNIWAKFADRNIYKDNKVDLIHPNGWHFSLGKFRIVPRDNYYRARLYIDYKVVTNGEETFESFSPFAQLFFGVDLDDCHLDELCPILAWCEKHTAAEFHKTLSRCN